MNHQIEQQDIVERYVRHKLSAEERRAFQEHYFECEECFEQVQTMARFVAGMQQASRKGLLAETATESWWANLFKPALVFGAAAALLLAVGVGWLLLKPNASPSQELAVVQSPTPTVSPTTTPTTEESRSNDLLARNRPQPTPDAAPGKVPVVFLDSERDAATAANQLTIPANTDKAIFRIEVEPGSTFSGFQFQVFDSAKRLVTTASGGKANAKGAVSASLSTQLLQSGKYVVKCYGIRDGQRELVGEYRLQIQKP